MKRDDFSWDDSGEQSVQRLLMKVTHCYFRKSFQQLHKTDIHPGQLPILNILSHKEGLSQREIARCLRIKPPTVTVSIRRLERIGIVHREQDPQDQRVSRIYLTEKGKSITRQLRRQLEENERVMLRGFDSEEIDLVQRYLNQMINNIETIHVEKE